MLLTWKKTLLEGYQQLRQLILRQSISSVEFKKQKAKELKEKWSEKRMHRQLIREKTEKVNRKKHGNRYQEVF